MLDMGMEDTPSLSICIQQQKVMLFWRAMSMFSNTNGRIDCKLYHGFEAADELVRNF